METGRPSLGPQVDPLFRTSQVGVFAAGNLLRGVETADWAALEGRNAARSIARYLETINGTGAGSRSSVRRRSTGSVRMCSARMSAWMDSAFGPGNSGKMRTLQLTQGERVLYQKRFSGLKANTSLNLGGEWVEKVDFTGQPVKLVVQAVSHGKVENGSCRFLLYHDSLLS